MKTYLAILSVPLTDHAAAKKHIAQTMSNGTKPINRSKLFTLQILMRGQDYKKCRYRIYRVCRIVTSYDIKHSGYCELSQDDWEKGLKKQTERVREWLKRKSTKVMENNKQTLRRLK